MNQAGEAGAREGIKIAIELVHALRADFNGIYLMPAFNRFDYAAEIIETVKREIE
jgi:homocysteine S-methyltransferase